MSNDLTYFVLDILKVGISRSTYYISFERMYLTGRRVSDSISQDILSQIYDVIRSDVAVAFASALE